MWKINKKIYEILTFIFISIFLITNLNLVQAASKYERIGGKDRYETSLKISEHYGSTGDCVILVSGSMYADALCAGPLAKKYNAPILLINSSVLNNNIKNKLKNPQTKKAFIIGGTGVISSSIEESIKKMNIQVERIGGKDRYQTSILVAERIDGTYEKNMKQPSSQGSKDNTEKQNEEKMSDGEKFKNDKYDKENSNLEAKDENTNVNIEKNQNENININKDNELVEKNKLQSESVDTDSKEKGKFMQSENKDNSYNAKEQLIENETGKNNVLEENEKQALQQHYNKPVEKNNKNLLENEEIKPQKINVKSIVVVSGENFPDALSIAPFAAVNSMPIILVKRDNISEYVQKYINDRNIEHTYIIGGVGVISNKLKESFSNSERIGGKERYQTNELIIEKFKDISSKERIYIASGEVFPDALSTVAVAQKYNAPIIITKDGIGAEHQKYAKKLMGEYDKKYVIGGTGVINQNALYLIGLESKPPAPKPKPQPKPQPKPSGIQAPTVPKYFTVMNAGETSKVYIKRYASAYSPNVGFTYGALAEAKVLKSSGNYYYVEALDYNSGKLVRGYVAKNMVRSIKMTSPYNILVDKSKQRVYIFKNNIKIKEFICSTGLDSTPTPSGRYLVGGKGKSFYASSSSICYFWTRINNNYLFHSVIYDLSGNAIKSEYVKLGKKASHGCIRLPYYDAKWLQDSIPKGTLVTIR